MSTDRPKLLQRAVGVVGSNGRPTVDGLAPEPKQPKRVKLSTSIRRKLTDIVRTRSLTTPKTNGLAHRGIPVHANTIDDVPTPRSGTPTSADVVVPKLLQAGTPLTKVTAKDRKQVVFSLDADQGHIVWEGRRHRIIPIEAIKEIRSGQDARYYRQQFQYAEEYEARWLTIIYILEGRYKTLHIIAHSAKVYHMWNMTLRRLHSIRQELMQGLGNVEMRQIMWEKYYWKNADEESDQKLVFNEVEKMCKRLNISTGQEDLYRLFKQADKQDRDFLDFADFRRFVKLLKSRPELDRLYHKCRGDGQFDFAAFVRFMQQKQMSTLSIPELQTIFDKYSTTTPSSPPPGSEQQEFTAPSPSNPVMSWDAFASFLMSNHNTARSFDDRKVHHDMTRPLSEYFISSSHNTYLVGHQLVGASTIEGYIRALLHSCRSVEIDVYDGDDGEPMIFHGKTFTSKVSLKEVCEAIIRYGFVTSPYPIIISAEMHATLDQQDRVAEIMVEVFGDALVCRVEGEPEMEISELPSPEDLKGKVLLKTKNAYLVRRGEPIDDLALDITTSSTSDSEDDRRRPEPTPDFSSGFRRAKSLVIQRVRSTRGKPVLLPTPSSPRPPTILESPVKGSFEIIRPNRFKSHRRSSSAAVASPTRPAFSSTVSAPPQIRRPSGGANGELQKPKMSFKLLALLVYTVGVKFRGINKKEEYSPVHMFSLSENTANKLIRGGAMMDVIKHTRDHLIRIYPKGMRLSSSNYEPHRYWSSGAQLVALNWQTYDLGYMINHAMFQRNGQCGYVLKPQALRAPQKDLLAQRTSYILDVNIISAQQLPRPKDASGMEVIEKGSVDPFVEVSVHLPDWLKEEDSSPAPSNSSASSTSPTRNTQAKTVTYKTGTVKNNGFNPVWEERLRIPFDCFGEMRDLIFVKFAVRQSGQEDDEPLAVFCAPLSSLQQGYRHLPLHDTQMSQFLFSTLFVRLGLTECGPP